MMPALGSIAGRSLRRRDSARQSESARELDHSCRSRCPVLGAGGRARPRTRGAELDLVSAIIEAKTPRPLMDPRRLRTLQGVGMLCGLTAGAWLGAAEAPTKLVTLGLSPVVI